MDFYFKNSDMLNIKNIQYQCFLQLQKSRVSFVMIHNIFSDHMGQFPIWFKYFDPLTTFFGII